MFNKSINEIHSLSKKVKNEHPLLSENLEKMCKIVEIDLQMAATRARICCEYIIRDVFRQEFEEPKKTLHYLIDKLQKNGKLPDHVKIVARFIKDLGNITSHSDPISLNEIDEYFVSSTLNSLIVLLSWYLNKIQRTSVELKPKLLPSEIYLQKIPKKFWKVYQEYFEIWSDYIYWGKVGFSLRMKSRGNGIIRAFPREGIGLIKKEDLEQWECSLETYNEYSINIAHIKAVQSAMQRKRRYIPHNSLSPEEMKTIFQATDNFGKVVKTLENNN